MASYEMVSDLSKLASKGTSRYLDALNWPQWPSTKTHIFYYVARDEVADTISKKFNAKCLPDHIDNHLRIVKTAWGIIPKLRNQSSCGWDENMRMIRMSPDVFNTYVEANPTHKKYPNKKIDMYDEMATMVGKDIARGSGARSFDDVEIQSFGAVNLEEKGDGDDEFVKENDKQSTLSAPLESRKSRMRTRDDDLKFQNISTQMAEVAMAL
ncbi:hypothetical protein Cgig2_008016 [Carnegiea gigantea]|uniref:Myb/SANT-like domain-containing protein n=1 Tax=Carnegiea gigantea TaxID=171969 RepID=A0A9Q1QSQ5_9CARY|nr:hypothetical protein Cgig2_008016 [Carnegiea gigantea]